MSDPRTSSSISYHELDLIKHHPYSAKDLISKTFTFVGPDFGLSSIIGPLYKADVNRVVSVLSVYVTQKNAPAYTLQIGTQNFYHDGDLHGYPGSPPLLQRQGTPYVAGHPETPGGNQVGIEMPLYAGETIMLQLANHGTFHVIIAIIS
jgi:hypothetical protein